MSCRTTRWWQLAAGATDELDPDGADRRARHNGAPLVVRGAADVAAGVGLDRERVIEEAAALADESGADAVTLAALAARLGVRSQSLYAHVDGLDGLRRDLAILGQQSLADRLGRGGDGPRR